MRIDWQEIKGTNLLELTWDLTRRKAKIILPKDISGSIIKVNFVLSKEDYKQSKIDVIMDMLREKKPLLLFIGKIQIKDGKLASKEEKSLPLSLSREELIKEFAKLFAPDRLRAKVISTAMNIMGKTAGL